MHPGQEQSRLDGGWGWSETRNLEQEKAQLAPLRGLGSDGRKGGHPEPSKPDLGLGRGTEAQR